MTDTLQTTATKPAAPKWEQDARDSLKAAIRKFKSVSAKRAASASTAGPD